MILLLMIAYNKSFPIEGNASSAISTSCFSMVSLLYSLPLCCRRGGLWGLNGSVTKNINMLEVIIYSGKEERVRTKSNGNLSKGDYTRTSALIV